MEVLSPPRKKPVSGDYWFIHGTSKKDQFILAFGTARTTPIRVNGHSVKSPNFGVVFWGVVDGEKKLAIDKAFPLEFPPKEPFKFDKKNKGYHFEFQDTKLTFADSYDKSLEASIYTNRISNKYLKVHGTLFGKRFKGRSYVQKVEVNTPLLSWDWLRFHGEKNIGTMFHIKGKPTLEFNGKKYKVDIEARDGMIKLTSSDVELLAMPYATHKIIIKEVTTLVYDEFFVHITGHVGRTEIDEFGMTEEARGIVF